VRLVGVEVAASSQYSWRGAPASFHVGLEHDRDLAELAGLLRGHDEVAQAGFAFSDIDLQLGDFLQAGAR
jgi:hypothetical protein